MTYEYMIFFAPLGAGVNEENQWIYMYFYRYSNQLILLNNSLHN